MVNPPLHNASPSDLLTLAELHIQLKRSQEENESRKKHQEVLQLSLNNIHHSISLLFSAVSQIKVQALENSRKLEDLQTQVKNSQFEAHCIPATQTS